MCSQFLEDLQRNQTGNHLCLFSHTSGILNPDTAKEKLLVCRSHVFLLHFFLSPQRRRPRLTSVPPSFTPALCSQAKVAAFVHMEPRTDVWEGGSARNLSQLSLFLSQFLSMVECWHIAARCPTTLGIHWECPCTGVSCQEMCTAFLLFSDESASPY